MNQVHQNRGQYHSLHPCPQWHAVYHCGIALYQSGHCQYQSGPRKGRGLRSQTDDRRTQE